MDGHDDFESWVQAATIVIIHELFPHPGQQFVGAMNDIGHDFNDGLRQNYENWQNCPCNPYHNQNQSSQSSESENNSYQQNAEQPRDAQGKFLPKQGVEAAPGSAAEKEALDAVGATKNYERIPGSNRIPDGTIEDAGRLYSMSKENPEPSSVIRHNSDKWLRPL